MILELGTPLILTCVAAVGESDAARFVAEKERQEQNELRQTETFGLNFAVLQELGFIKQNCAAPGWDGYDAKPVLDATVWITYQFLNALPHGLPPPGVSAEPDGHITLEWYSSPRRVLSVSIAPDSSLHYAALAGPNKQYGTEIFFGEVPQSVLDLIKRIQG